MLPGVTTVPSSVTLPAPVVAPVSDPALTKLSIVAPPAPLSNLQVTEDARRKPQAIIKALENTLASANASVSGNFSTGVSRSAPQPGASSAFIAQLLAQSDSLALAAARFAPAPTYNMLQGYSLIKYKPSEAGLNDALRGGSADIVKDTAGAETESGLVQYYASPTPTPVTSERFIAFDV